MKRKMLFLFTSFCLSVSAPIGASGNDEHGHDAHGEHEEHGKSRTHISPKKAQEVGITTAVAGPGTLAQTITTYGRLTTSPENVSHIRARFPGLITDVRAGIGDNVQAGDVLASIESNESLKVYQVRSPIAGVITQRHANTGESTQSNVLFTVANLESLWAELKVFPSQRAQVTPGDTVVISTDSLSQTTSLRHLVPGDEGQPFVVARAEIDNSEGRWAPGLLLNGTIHTDTIEAPLVVTKQALQTLDGQTVVFIVAGKEFVARPVETGRSDAERTEILSGLEAGESYVVENSYLIKADIEKAGAEHSH